MPSELKQFVPSEFCLKCDVCCRFPDKNSAYAPVFLPDESPRQISLKPLKDIFICPHFIPTSNSCRIYRDRPFDCRLYPFVLAYDKEYKNIILCADTKCPYINSNESQVHSHEFKEYTEYLLGFLKKQNLPHSFIMPCQPDAIKIDVIKNLGGFKALALEHRDLFDKYLTSSEYSARCFASIYVWSDLFNILWKIIDDNLCIFYGYKNEFNMMFPPLAESGPPSPKAIAECIGILAPGGRIENIALEEIRMLENAGVKIHKNTYEYIYLAKDIAELKGNKFASQRAAVNQFIKNNKYIYRPFNITDADDCLGLYMDWASQRKKTHRDSVYNQLLEDNLSAHRIAMLNHERLGLVGRVVEIDGKIRAYAFAFGLNEEICCVNLETADLKVKGLAQFIYKRLAGELKDAKYINAMDDSGLENLRRVKLSWRPCKILSNYIGVVKPKTSAPE